MKNPLKRDCGNDTVEVDDDTERTSLKAKAGDIAVETHTLGLMAKNSATRRLAVMAANRAQSLGQACTAQEARMAEREAKRMERKAEKAEAEAAGLRTAIAKMRAATSETSSEIVVVDATVKA